jgi:hypothetical protein
MSLGVTVALLPVVLSLSAVPAAAAGSSLTVTTIGRNGAQVTSHLLAVDLTTGTQHTFSSGKLHSLPKGQYGLVTDIESSGTNSTDTLAARVLTVSGKTSVTFDARKGKAVKVSVGSSTDSAATDGTIDARVCAADNSPAQIEASNSPGALFVIPSSSKSLSFAYLGDWRGSTTYIASGATHAGIPSSPGGHFAASSMAKLHVQVRANEEGGTENDIAVQPLPETDSCQTDLYGTVADRPVPYSADALVSSGRWQARDDVFAVQGGGESDIGGGFETPTAFTAGHSYTEYWNRAAWGPATWLPETYDHAINFIPDAMISGPTASMGESAINKATITLTKAGKLVKKSTLTSYGNGPQGFSAHISEAGWYQLTADASRYYPGITFPSGLLSKRTVLSTHFYANPAAKPVTAPVFLTGFTPIGLNTSNHAAAHSVTSVDVVAHRPAQGGNGIPLGKDAVKTIKVWASYDNGTTWHAVGLVRTGSTWSATVHNPASGQVSLRSEITDAGGNSSEETVYGAYGIG